MFTAYIKLLKVADLLDVPVVSANWFASRGVTTLCQEAGTPKSIVLRPNLSAEEMIIALAHEIGHIVDWQDNPLTRKELKSASDGEALLLPRREETAWDKAEQLLRVLGLFKQFRMKFYSFKTASLSAYQVTGDEEEDNECHNLGC